MWGGNEFKASRKGNPEKDPTGTIMPSLYRRAGFDTDGGKVRVGTGSAVQSTRQARERLAWRARGQLKPGDVFYQSWLDAGITEEEIQETLAAVDKWVETEDAWFASLQCDMLAWK